MSTAEKELLVFDFTNPEILKPWQIINDTVMGGASESRLVAGGAGTALFTGRVSLENYGGFCSTSSRDSKKYDLSGYNGIAIRVKGDGKTYKLTLKTDTDFSGYAYQFAFNTENNRWITVQAPFAACIARFRGMTLPDAPPIHRSEIRSFGFLIGDKQKGPFALEIAWIKAY